MYGLSLFQIFRSNGWNKLTQFTYEHEKRKQKNTHGASALVSALRTTRPAERCECVLDIRSGERTLSLVRFSSFVPVWTHSTTWAFTLRRHNTRSLFN